MPRFPGFDVFGGREGLSRLDGSATAQTRVPEIGVPKTIAVSEMFGPSLGVRTGTPSYLGVNAAASTTRECSWGQRRRGRRPTRSGLSQQPQESSADQRPAPRSLGSLLRPHGGPRVAGLRADSAGGAPQGSPGLGAPRRLPSSAACLASLGQGQGLSRLPRRPV